MLRRTQHALTSSRNWRLHVATLNNFRRPLWTSSLDAPVQSYISTSRDPHLNLSIEHRLLQSSAPDSTVLFFYTNSRSIVIGRNQNPWLETRLSGILPSVKDGSLHLVRRRSGGGTVFHDEGNINWTVISPSKSFQRDTHAEMVVRALRSCGVDRARVNERHDIVLDHGTEAAESAKSDIQTKHEHWTPWTQSSAAQKRAFKCSGSAFKLIRHRALHHGTCLLHTEDLGRVGQLLRSEGRPYIQAKGVESVSSPIANVGISHEDFVDAVREQFARMYQPDSAVAHRQLAADEAMQDANTVKGYEELRTPEWTFAQTPRFSFTVDTGSVEELSALPPLKIAMEVEKGQVTSLRIKSGAGAAEMVDVKPLYDGCLSWSDCVDWDRLALDQDMRASLAQWLQRVLPAI